MASEKIKAFNKIIESFLSQTSKEVGTTYYFYFSKLVKVNSLIAMNHGIKLMLPYKDKIFNKDESYFSEEDVLVVHLNKNTTFLKSSTDEILTEIFRLKNIYYKLDDESKDNVWSIMQALTQLMIEYCEIKKITY